MRGLRFNWTFFNIYPPIFSNSTFLINLVPLKKYWLRLVWTWTFVQIKPALRQYFFVTSNCFEKKQLWKINFSILKILNFFKKILKKFIRKSKKIIVNILKIEYLNNWLFNEIWQLLLYFFQKFTENLNSKIQRFGKKMKKSLCNLENNLRTKNCIILTNSDKKSLKILKNTKISTAGNIILAKCGLEFCIEFVKFSFAAAFHIVFLFNFINLKKHRLRLWILELKFFEFPALRQYFFVGCNLTKPQP